MTRIEELQRLAVEQGACAFGTARLADLRTDDFLLPAGLLNRLPLAVSLALRLSPAVLETLEGAPNRLYEHHYRQLNFALDRLALAACGFLESLGYRALPIPASQIVDWENQRAHLSHKRVAVAAGLGHIGRNNLLVTPRFGAQVRLVTILTDIETGFGPIASGRTASSHGFGPTDCGSCRACVSACPAHAIADAPGEFNHLACYEKLKEFQRLRLVSQYICGLCVRACCGREA